MAQRRVDSTTRIIRQSESVRQQADSLIRNRKNDFDRIYNKNEVTVREINVTLSDFRRKIVDLNDVVSLNIFYRLNSKKITINWILLRLKNSFFSFLEFFLELIVSVFNYLFGLIIFYGQTASGVLSSIYKS